MKRPTLETRGGHWLADLRAFGFGRYRLGLASEIDQQEAMHRAYAKLAYLRNEGMADVAQRDLFEHAGPDRFGAAIDRCSDDKRHVTDGGRHWWNEYARLVRTELGGYGLQEFAPPTGNARLVEYVKQCEARQMSGRTIRNRLSVAEQVLRFAVERGWLAAAPLHPRMPPKAAPVYHYLTEANFRALRVALYRGRDGTVAELRGFTPTEPGPIYIARRKVYLSWLFYTGVHKHDADAATSDWLFLDGRAYIRHNSKSSRSVPDEQFEMPDQLHDDLHELQAVLGRPFWPGEQFTGGPWVSVNAVMKRAAQRIGFPHPVNPAILRRSYAREMLQRGYSVREVADRMGHVDERMLREIYTRFPRAAGRPRTRWTADAITAQPTPPSGLARVLQLRPTHEA